MISREEPISRGSSSPALSLLSLVNIVIGLFSTSLTRIRFFSEPLAILGKGLRSDYPEIVYYPTSMLLLVLSSPSLSLAGQSFLFGLSTAKVWNYWIP